MANHWAFFALCDCRDIAGDFKPKVENAGDSLKVWKNTREREIQVQIL